MGACEQVQMPTSNSYRASALMPMLAAPAKLSPQKPVSQELSLHSSSKCGLPLSWAGPARVLGSVRPQAERQAPGR